ncbi:MAG: oligosaccharide flippase family protein [Thermodesulfobacteriota bacterium]
MLSQSLRNNVVANFFGQGWTAFMGLAFIPVYIHFLGVEAWGLVGFMTMMQAWLTLLDLGLTPTLGREMARFGAGVHTAQSIRNLLRSLEVLYVGVAVTVACLAWIAAPWVAAHWLSAAKLSTDSVARAVGVMGLVLAARMVEQVYRGAIQGLQLQVWLNGAQSILSSLRWGGAAGVLALVSSPGIGLFFAWQGGISLLTVMILARKTYLLLPPGERPGHFELAALVRIRRFASGIAMTTLLALLLTQVDKLLLSKLVSLEEFGHYTLAASVAGALYFLAAPVTAAVSPRLTELVATAEERNLVSTYHSASQWLALMLVPSGLFLAGFAQPLLWVWTGNDELAYRTAPLLTLLALGTLCNGLLHVPYTTQLAYGWTGLAVRVNVVAVGIIIPAILSIVPFLGAIGAAWIWLFLNIGYLLFAIHLMHRRLLAGEKWNWYRNAVCSPLLIGVITTLVLRLLVYLPTDRLLLSTRLLGILFIMIVTVALAIPVVRNFILSRVNYYKRNW